MDDRALVTSEGLTLWLLPGYRALDTDARGDWWQQLLLQVIRKMSGMPPVDIQAADLL